MGQDAEEAQEHCAVLPPLFPRCCVFVSCVSVSPRCRFPSLPPPPLHRGRGALLQIMVSTITSMLTLFGFRVTSWTGLFRAHAVYMGLGVASLTFGGREVGLVSYVVRSSLFALNKCASRACIMKVFSYCLEWFSLTRGSSISTSSCCLEGFSPTSLTHSGSVARLECVSAFEICVFEYGFK